MAGRYADAPSRRLAWDADGTVPVGRRTVPTSTAGGELSVGTKIELNDEDEVDVAGSDFGVPASQSNDEGFLAWLFPELREVDGFFGRMPTGANPPLFTGGSIPASVQSSVDTTNGTDGTWATLIGSYSPGNQKVFNDGEYRQAITSLAASNIRGVRVHMRRTGAPVSIQARAFHWYGEISPGQTPDRLLFIDDATGLEFTLPQDWGDVPRGGSEDKALRVKNNSAAQTANTVQYTVEALYRSSAGWYTLTLPGGSTYQSVQQISSIAADTTTGIITLRRITPGTGGLGLHAGSLYLNVASWT